MEREELAAGAWFQKINTIGSKTMYKLRDRFGSLQEAYLGSEQALREIFNSRQYTAYKAARYAMSPEAYLSGVEEKGIRYVSVEDDIFPERLRNIPDPPYGIFVKGRLPEEYVPCVAMIGSRACSRYGRAVSEMFAEALAERGIQVVSGMARGIDSISQSACIAAGGKTFAVLGSGVDVCYPKELSGLYEKISQKGGIISTYPPGMQPLAANFPPRNRIISGLSDIVLVVESRLKSGTLITVDMALEQGREVAVVPGRITDELSKGCHALIRQGASPVYDTEQLLLLLEDIWENRNFTANNGQDTSNRNKTEQERIHMNNRELSPFLKSIWEMLDGEPVNAEEIYLKWVTAGHKGSFQEVLGGLTDLELMDLCKSDKNLFFIH